MAYTSSLVITPGIAPATGFSAIGAFSVSRDGTKAVLVTDTGLWQLTFAGTILTLLTVNFSSTISLQYSPDGSKIVLSQAAGGFYEIWTLNADGTGQVRILLGTSRFGYYAPSWNAAGTKILLSVTDNTLTDISGQLYTCNPDGSSLTFLAGGIGPGEDWQAVFSPDGTKIAFNKQGSVSSDGLYTMLADGSGQVFTGLPLANTENNVIQQTIWAPDNGSFLLTGISGLLDVQTSNLDGSNQVIIFSGFEVLIAHYLPSFNIIILGIDGSLYTLTGSGSGPTTITDYGFDCATKYLTIIGTNFLTGATVTVVNPLGQQKSYTSFISQISTQIVVDISDFYVDFGDSQWCFTVTNP